MIETSASDHLCRSCMIFAGKGVSVRFYLSKRLNEWAEFAVFFRGSGDKAYSQYKLEIFPKRGVSSSASVVLVAFTRVATSPSVTSLWLASSDEFFDIVGGASLCLLSSCIVLAGSTRLTQISSLDFRCSPESFVCVAVAVVSFSVWHYFVSGWSVFFLCSVWLVCTV